MNKILKSILALVIVLGFQVIIYLIFFHSHIIRWGASETESTMNMPGDKYAQSISSTRAININISSEAVWSYLADLGADRKGYYSYDFVEKIFGYYMAKAMNPNNRELYLGRIIAVDSSNGVLDGFKVIEIDNGRYFVLKNWGDFATKKINDKSTRLIIRTHETKAKNIFEKLNNSVFDAMHYIMEKRMMLGIKDLAESNNVYTQTNDSVWLLGIFLSGLAGIVMVFVSKGYLKYTYPTILYFFWQLVVFVMNPLAIYAIILMLAVTFEFLIIYYSLRLRSC